MTSHDAHIGEHIADTYLKARFLITKGLGWMEYDGKRWVSVAEPVIGEAVRLGVLDLYAAEMQAGATTERLKAISSLFSASRIFAIVRIAKGYLWVRDEEFDAHPDLLNVNNGVVDLRDGSLGRTIRRCCSPSCARPTTSPARRTRTGRRRWRHCPTTRSACGCRFGSARASPDTRHPTTC